MARTRAVRLSDTANSSPGAGPSSRPAPAKGQRSKKTSNTAAVTNDRIDVRSTASDDPSPTIAKVKAPVKPKDPCADFPDFSAPAYLASAIHPAPAAKPKKIAQAPRSPPPVIATSSLTLVNSPEHGRAANVAAQWKRSAAVKRTSKAPRKAQRKMPDLDSDCTAASSPLSSPLSSPMLARNKSLTELLGDETDEEEDRESQNLDTLFADLDKMERNKLDHVEEQIVVAMVQGLFQPSTLPDGVSVGDPVYSKSGGCWWPAKLLAFVPAVNVQRQAAGKDKWLVIDRFGKTREHYASSVIHKYDQRIADCILGTTESTRNVFTSDAATRPASPPPASAGGGRDRSTVPCEAFVELHRVEQFRFIRPHLQLVIEEGYAPSQSRIDDFFAGARSRGALALRAQLGDIPEEEAANVLYPELERWAIRGGSPETMPSLMADLRPVGSARYNELALHDLRSYLTDILLPEAIIEMCIQSYGERALLAAKGGEIDDDETGDDDNTDVDPSESYAIPDDSKLVLAHANVTPLAPAEERLYQAAQSRLTQLARTDEEKSWSTISAVLRNARRVMRKQLKLPQEGMNEYEKKKYKLTELGMEEGWASGRARERLEYAESSDESDQGQSKRRRRKRAKKVEHTTQETTNGQRARQKMKAK